MKKISTRFYPQRNGINKDGVEFEVYSLSFMCPCCNKKVSREIRMEGSDIKIFNKHQMIIMDCVHPMEANKICRECHPKESARNRREFMPYFLHTWSLYHGTPFFNKTKGTFFVNMGSPIDILAERFRQMEEQ